jgi:hypothetical protein
MTGVGRMRSTIGVDRVHDLKSVEAQSIRKTTEERVRRVPGQDLELMIIDQKTNTVVSLTIEN